MKLTKHLPHYVPLLGVIFAGLLGFLIFSYDRVFQTFILVAVASTYVFWGIIHHKIHDDLHIMVVVEYLVIATLGLVIVFSILFRA
jgi:hypothetical protein